jgi:hypothetical protein
MLLAKGLQAQAQAPSLEPRFAGAAALAIGDSAPPTGLCGPTGVELANHPIVIRAMDEAWRDSNPGDPMTCHEEGGWIYLNRVTGQIFTHRAPPGGQAFIDLSEPVLYLDAVVVGSFHTHPNLGWVAEPSDADFALEDARRVPGLVRSEFGIHPYGRFLRRERLDGAAGFPFESP